ncbi:MAG: LysR family transcriptional regulator [Burkholderiaceae bacterium]
MAVADMTSASKKLLQRRHVEALVEIGNSHSVHRAARNLGMPQPVLSRLLSEAEVLLGMQLFERSSHGSKPTPQGEAVLSHARFLLRAFERLNAVVANAKPTIQLGCIPRAMHTLMPQMLAIMYSAVEMRSHAQPAAPQCCFRVIEGTSRTLFDAIAAGSLDFAILRSGASADDDDRMVEHLYDERTVIVCAAPHERIPVGPVALSRLASEGWALPEAETTSRVAFNEFWHAHGLAPVKPVIETRSFESNLALVVKTRLISIAPESIARSYVDYGVLRIVKLRRALPSIPVMLAFSRMVEADPVLNGFRQLIHKAAATILER